MVEEISEQTGQPKNTVIDIIKGYTKYIYEQTALLKPVKFLHLFYLDIKHENENTERDTLAYVCTELAKGKVYTGHTVRTVLESYEECILDALADGDAISIYGIARVSVNPNLRIRKTGRLANTGYRVKATKHFREEANSL
jgi:nucleoid DNA-binding protein